LTTALAMLDAWPAPVLPLVNRPVPASTVTWHAQVVAEAPAEGWAPTGWWRYEAASAVAGGGYAGCDASIWAPDGTLFATGRQLVVEFSG
jgi:acyl-CoA hydrolase